MQNYRNTVVLKKE